MDRLVDGETYADALPSEMTRASANHTETWAAVGSQSGSTAFLLRATRALADSLNIETTLKVVARLSLPHLGSWCIVDLCDGDEMRRVAIVHPDATLQRLADALLSGWPPHRDDPLGLPSVIRTRRSQVDPVVTDDMLAGAAGSPENLAILRKLQIGSLMTVPLAARGSVFGAITFVAPSSGSAFSDGELELAEDLAARCAIAIDNARLFRHAEEAKMLAEEANLTKMRFLSTMSHELRTPLNAIGGYTQLLQAGLRGALTEPQLRDLERIQVNQRHLLGLVEAVLSFARLESGRIEFGLGDVPLASVLADTEILVAPLASAKGVTLAGLDLSGADADFAVYADREKLQQILVNLLTNSVKFSRPGSTIEVTPERIGDRVEIRVSDRGVGIAPEDLEKIFEPFVQVDEGLKTTHGGIGLGLAISRELAIGMGGSLFAESLLGSGSTFTLTLSHGRGSSWLA